jgi:transcriptional regulator with XRE-family HTH domain
MLEHLRGLREDRDLSQKDMAEILKVHQTTYSDYELENLNIPIETLKQLAIFHNTSVDYLLGLTNVREPYPRA